MNPILIVLPILAVLMFDLGLVLTAGDFSRVSGYVRTAGRVSGA